MKAACPGVSIRNGPYVTVIIRFKENVIHGRDLFQLEFSFLNVKWVNLCSTDC